VFRQRGSGERGREDGPASAESSPPCPATARRPPKRVHVRRHSTVSAVDNIPFVDFASITLYGPDDALSTVAATDPLAVQLDALQYELHKGPCYAAVTRERIVLVNDVATSADFPRYGVRAADLGVRSQAAIQLVHNGDRAGLNLYARRLQSFDRSTAQLAELFSTHAAALLNYATQVEQLQRPEHQDPGPRPTGHRRHVREHARRGQQIPGLALAPSSTPQRRSRPSRPGRYREVTLLLLLLETTAGRHDDERFSPWPPVPPLPTAPHSTSATSGLV
jgi:hypothetical protein